VFSAIPDDVRAVVVHGIGDHFSAGLDLSELTERDATAGLVHSQMWHRVFDRIQYCRVPVISALKGAVIGGGLELACATHIRVAEPSAYYALPEGQRGIFVGGGGSVRLPRLIGVARMADMMLTGPGPIPPLRACRSASRNTSPLTAARSTRRWNWPGACRTMRR